MKVRLGTVDDVPSLMRIEREAATRFVEAGLPGAVALPCLAAEDFEDVLVAEDGVVIGFAVVSTCDEDLHLDELDVSPSHAGRGVGRLLLRAVAELARGRGCRRVTLTTFRDVPFNAPFYARVGFVEAHDARLDALLEDEVARGIAIAPRVAMELLVGS